MALTSEKEWPGAERIFGAPRSSWRKFSAIHVSIARASLRRSERPLHLQSAVAKNPETAVASSKRVENSAIRSFFMSIRK